MGRGVKVVNLLVNTYGNYLKMEKGRTLAKEIIENALRPSWRFNQLILNGLDEPTLHGVDLTPRCPHCRKILETSEIT
jgi:hypothetical protein